MLWTHPQFIPGQDLVARSLRNGVVCHDGVLYAAVGDRVYALKFKSGELQTLWQYKVSAPIPGPPVLGSDECLRVHSGDGLLHALDLEGKPTWPAIDVGEPLGWAAPLVDRSNNTWISAYTGGITKVSPQGVKSNRPFFRSRQKFDSTGLLRDHMLYIGAEDAFVYAIDLSGQRGRSIWDQAEDRGKTEWFINSAPAYHPRGLIIVAGRDEYLYGFEEDGGTRFKVHIRGQMLGSPVVAPNGTIYVGVSLLQRGHAPRGQLIAVDPDVGQVAWEYDADGPVESTPVVGDNELIYFGDNAGHLHCVTPQGTAKWRRNVKSPIRSHGNLLSPRQIVFGTDNGTLVAVVADSKNCHTAGWPRYLGS